MKILTELLENSFACLKQCVDALVAFFQQVYRFFQPTTKKWAIPKKPEVYPKSYGLFSGDAPFFKGASNDTAKAAYQRVQQHFNPVRCFS